LIRGQIQLLSKETKVPIEPERSTKLINEILNLENVVYAAVPGAGGDDAIFIMGTGDNFHQYIQENFCDKINDTQIAVLSISLLPMNSILLEECPLYLEK